MKSPLQLAQWAAYEKLTQQRNEERAAIADKAKEGERLLAEAAKWQHAQEIRGYVAEILRLAGPGPTPAITEWAKWALQVAAMEDPIPAKLASLRHGANG